MKKILQSLLGLVFSSMGSLEKTKAYSSYGYAGFNIGWHNFQQTIESEFEPSLLKKDQFENDISSLNPTVLEPLTEETVKSAQNDNQQFIMQNPGSFKLVSANPNLGGEVFFGGECRDGHLIYQTQLGICFYGTKQKFSYPLIKSSLVNQTLDTHVQSNGEPFATNSLGGVINPLFQHFGYNGVSLSGGTLTLEQTIGIKCLFGFGFEVEKIGFIVNIGYTGVINKISLDFQEVTNFSYDSENKTSEDDNKDSSILTRWAHGFPIGMQLTFPISPAIDFLIFYQKTFYLETSFDFTELVKEKIKSTSFSYYAETNITKGNHKDNKYKKELRTLDSTIVGEGDPYLEICSGSTYVGIGFRFKIGGGE